MAGDARLQAMTEDELNREKLRLEIAGLRAQQPHWLHTAQPYLLLLLTAAVSEVVLPHLSRRSQVSEKELEIKTALVNDINRSIAAFVHEIQVFEVGKVHTAGAKQDFTEVNVAYKQWSVDNSGISARIHAYFPGLAGEWEAYAQVLEEVYALTGTTKPDLRHRRVDGLRAYFPEANIDWGVLADTGAGWVDTDAWRPYEKAWFALRGELLKVRDRLVSRMLQSSTTLS